MKDNCDLCINKIYIIKIIRTIEDYISLYLITISNDYKEKNEELDKRKKQIKANDIRFDNAVFMWQRWHSKQKQPSPISNSAKMYSRMTETTTLL